MSKLHSFDAASDSDSVRRHAYERYVTGARQRNQKTVSINVGEIHREMGFSNRVPLVCAALGSKKFLKQHGLRLISRQGPPSGQSTTVTFTYEMLPTSQGNQSREEAWHSLRGIGKDVFASFGGGEAYLKQERATFYAPGRDSMNRKP